MKLLKDETVLIAAPRIPARWTWVGVWAYPGSEIPMPNLIYFITHLMVEDFHSKRE
jgi:hypothetical protein